MATETTGLIERLHKLAEIGEGDDREWVQEIRAVVTEAADALAGPLVYHVHQEVNEAHVALDRIGAPKTRRVPNRAGDGEQEITLGLKDRIRSLGSNIEPVK